MKSKCEICNSCLQSVWILPRRFFYCDFCDKYFDLVDGKLVEVGKEIINSYRTNQVRTR